MRKKSCVTLMALLVSSQVGYADEAPADVYVLPEVVVTATKTNMDVKDVPTAVEVITQEEIQARGAKTLKDILRTAADVNVVRSGRRDGLSIRGFDSRFCLILIDGRRASAEVDTNMELDRIFLENVERIEIVRGPGSSLYGTDALGGVVNIITKSSDKPGLSLRADYGAFSGSGARKNYDIFYDMGKIGKVGAVLSGTYWKSNALFRSDGTTYDPYGTRKTANAEFDYRMSNEETMTFTAAYMQEEIDEVYYQAVGTQKVKADSHEINDRKEYALSYQYEKDGNSAFLRAAQSIYHKDTEFHLANGNWNFAIARRAIPTFEGRITRPAGEDHSITIGAEYRPETFRGTSVTTGEGAFTVTRDGKTATGSKAAIDYTAGFVQDEWRVSPKLLAVTSLRYDDSNRFESNFSPKLGLTYKAEDDVRVKFNVGKGFRSPTPNQLYINTATLVGDVTLESEESDFFEVSVEKDFGQASGKLTYFNNKVTNLIEQVSISINKKQYQNIGKATLEGVEMEVSHPLTDKLTWSGSYAYLEAVNDQNNTRLTNRPRHKVASHMKYVADSGWKADLWTEIYGNYLVPSYQDNAVNAKKSYGLWNLQFSQTVDKDTQIVVGVDNLFNKKDEDMPLTGTYIHSSIQFKM